MIATKTRKNNKNQIKVLFSLAESRSIVKKIVFTGMMLGVILIFSYIETITTLGWGFLQVNFSLVFILASLFYSGKKQTFLLLLCKLFLTPIIVQRVGYLIDLTNNFILFVQEALFIICILTLSRIKKLSTAPLVIISLILTSAIIPWIRASFLQPLFYYVYGWSDTVSLDYSYVVYNMDISKPFYFYIHNYWLGNFVTFFLSNLIRFSVAVIILLPIIKIISLKGNNGWNFSRKKSANSNAK